MTRVKSEEKLFSDEQQSDHLPITSTTVPSLDTHLPERPPHLTPTPPDPMQQPVHLTPTVVDTPYQQPGTRRLPTPPATSEVPQRPKSVADFRQRRYRKLSTEVPRYDSPNHFRHILFYCVVVKLACLYYIIIQVFNQSLHYNLNCKIQDTWYNFDLSFFVIITTTFEP